eukprot:NODE_2178_length_980_cov_471.198919.p1 GENE.NODE_2178_length_980_cov_471.198919~~NODE_2178_length_980_cov_471.198919.p1  ORF type:complete len:299 (+),score=88.11 NODE_2178_length_980_cov_471.198919:3-899(+)
MGGTGEIDRVLLEDALKDERVAACLWVEGIETSQAHELLYLLNAHSSERAVDIDKFLQSLMRLKGGASALDLATLMLDTKRMCCKLEEHNNDNQRKFGELCVALRRIGANLPKKDSTQSFRLHTKFCAEDLWALLKRSLADSSAQGGVWPASLSTVCGDIRIGGLLHERMARGQSCWHEITHCSEEEPFLIGYMPRPDQESGGPACRFTVSASAEEEDGGCDLEYVAVLEAPSPAADSWYKAFFSALSANITAAEPCTMSDGRGNAPSDSCTATEGPSATNPALGGVPGEHFLAQLVS